MSLYQIPRYDFSNTCMENMTGYSILNIYFMGILLKTPERFSYAVTPFMYSLTRDHDKSIYSEALTLIS